MSAQWLTAEQQKHLRHWLGYWKPAVVLGTDADGSEHKIAVPKTQRKWKTVQKAIADIELVAIRALNVDGDVVATMSLRDEDDEDDEPAAPAAPGPMPATSSGADMASVVHTVAKAVTSSNIELVKAVSQTSESAFKELLSIVKLLSERLSALEQMWHERFTRDLDREQEQRSEGSGDKLVEAIISAVGPDAAKAFVAQFVPKLAPKAIDAKTNGAG